jgi:hypothetical protein
VNKRNTELELRMLAALARAERARAHPVDQRAFLGRATGILDRIATAIEADPDRELDALFRSAQREVEALW